MRCCEAWEPVGKCFDPISFECSDFHRLSQINASVTRETLRYLPIAEPCFFPKSSDVDKNGRIVRLQEALRPLTLQVRLQDTHHSNM